MSLTYNQLISTFVATILIICYWTLGHVTHLPLASFVLIASVHIPQKNDTQGMFAPFSFGIKCNTSLVLNKRNLPKRVPFTKERLSNLPLFCIWVTYSLWYWESLKVSRAERGGKEKNPALHHCTSFDAAFRRRWSFSLPWLNVFLPDRNLHYWKDMVVHTNSPLLNRLHRTDKWARALTAAT